MDIVSITIPYPDKILNPNEEIHITKKTTIQQVMYYQFQKREAKKAAFDEAVTLTNNVLQFTDYNPKDYEKKWLVREVYLQPPDNRRRDDDNILASLKKTFDGMAKSLGIDDWYIRNTKEIRLNKSDDKIGRIKIVIKEANDEQIREFRKRIE